MIGIVNESTQVPADVHKAVVEACAIQIEHHFAPAYSRRPPMPTLFQTVNDVPSGVPLIRIVDQIDDVGALGYHTIAGSRVTGMVGITDILAAGGTLTMRDVSYSAVLSHECLEAAFDPFVNKWIQDAGGRLWAAELCDPCQSQFYLLDGIAVSNFVLPQFWNMDPPSTARFDHLGQLSGPFTLAPGGYAVLRQPDGSFQQIGQRPAWKPGFRAMMRQTPRTIA